MAEKTEAPTPRRRDEARAKGQGIGRSHEFSMGLTLGVGTLALSTLLPGMAAQLVTKLTAAITDVPTQASNAQLIGATGDAILTTLILILPLALIVMIAGIAGNIVSGGLIFSYKAIRFDPSRINPLAGMKRILDKQALVRLGLAATKLAILAFVSWQVVGSRIPTIVATQGESAADIAGSCLSAVFQLGLTMTILLAVVALTDFVIQRRKASQSIRMTKDEVKREFRESEGDPMIRSARRRRARQMAFARMMDAIPTSDVVVTNPTTLAVALKYDSLTMKAPRIMAKGQRLMADRIKQIAAENKVPIIEDKPLARALFSRPVGSEVPSHLYRAVARLLVLVHQARFAGGRAGAARAGQRAGGRGWTPGAQGAGAGFASQPWWNAAGSANGRAILSLAAGAQTAGDTAAGARVYGGAADSTDSADGKRPGTFDPATGANVVTEAGEQAQPDEAWLDDAALTLDDVDEDALAVALAEDELGDMTPDELARLDAGLVLGPDEEDDPDTDDGEQDQ